MAAPNYRLNVDEFYNSNDDVSDDEPLPRDTSRRRQEWLDEHYEVLAELYHDFTQRGVGVFGYAFFQLGDFYQFAHFIYENTTLVDADLLRANVTQQHVGALGLGPRREHRLHGLQKPDNDDEARSTNEGVRGCWTSAVHSGTTRWGEREGN